MMRKILVAVDGSKSSKKGALKAANMAAELGAEVTLIHIYKDILQLPISQFNEASTYLSAETLEKVVDDEEDSIKNMRQEILNEVKDLFIEQGITPKTVLLEGDPADVICNYAEENSFDLIVVADKGHGKVERFLLGSISDKIVHHARVSVMVVK